MVPPISRSAAVYVVVQGDQFYMAWHVTEKESRAKNSTQGSLIVENSIFGNSFLLGAV